MTAGFVRNDCTPVCAEPVKCPVCGNDLPPRGRSVPLAMPIPACCDKARRTKANTRHLWSVDELAKQ
jgi:hypothetical protein